MKEQADAAREYARHAAPYPTMAVSLTRIANGKMGLRPFSGFPPTDIITLRRTLFITITSSVRAPGWT
jgi:hypothetical protein